MVLGALTLVLLGFQLFIMARQTDILRRQTALGEQQSAWRRDEALGTFYRAAFDLASEFRKANIFLPGSKIPADFATHPRELLREASRLFAPLGNSFVMAVNTVAMRLDEYFSAVLRYNSHVGTTREAAQLLVDVEHFREALGRDLDQANRLIPTELRWKYDSGGEYNFRQMCSAPDGVVDLLKG